MDKAISSLIDIGMTKKKIDHSKRVAETIKNIGEGEDAQIAASLHDYVERGGNLEDAQKKLGFSQTVANIICYLSDLENVEDENRPLSHIQSVLKKETISQKEKRIVALIKIADRIDNLCSRIDRMI